jgi:hypothetical protein
MPNETETADCRRRHWRRALGATAAAWLAASAPGLAAQTHVLRLRCTNPVSGASWPLVVDLARSRVDSLAATISQNSISWHDPRRGFFDLDRATGKLQLRNASATGGYFLYYTCRPE